MKIMHLRTDNGPIGTLVDNGDNIGIAICSTKDRFSKKLGVKIAAGRSNKSKLSLDSLPRREVIYNGKTVKIEDFVVDSIIYLRSKNSKKVVS